MRKNIFVVMLLVASEGLCQTPAKEPDTLQSLLLEVHQLRQDIEAMMATSQRVQMALYSLQIQDSAVARSAQRLDNQRNKCSGEEQNRQHTLAEIQKLEGSLASGTLSETETKVNTARLAEMKTLIDPQTAEVATCQSGEAEASNQLRNDQASLAELRDQLQRLDKVLENVGAAAK